MTLNKRLLALLTGVLFVFTLPGWAQERTCPHASGHTPAAGKSDDAGIQRQKPMEPAVIVGNRPEVYVDEMNRANKAAEVVAEMPKKFDFLDKAEAIAVIPGVKKAALGLGGRWGKGLISMRDECGHWIPPSFIQISGGSIGFQIGVQSTDLVLVFTDKDAVDSLLRAKMTFNGNASGAAGPIGRDLQAGTDLLVRSGILAYSHNKGLFAGVSLDGAAITIDDSANQKVYGNYIHGDYILKTQGVQSNEAVEPFLAALEKYVPASPHSHQTTTD
jgi:lipid-binding SYLF domain-containing protein